jgi:hypothetical protein
MKLISNALTLFIIIALVMIWMQGKQKEQATLDLNEGILSVSWPTCTTKAAANP